jgi:hypothetical protein
MRYTASAQKSPGKCWKCGKPIEIGQAFMFAKAYKGERRNWHNTPECQPSASEREFNEKRAAYLRAEEHLSDLPNDHPHEAAEHIRAAVEEIQSVVDGIDEALESWQGTPLESTDRYSTWETMKDDFETWINAAESAADTLEAQEEKDDPEYDEEIPDQDNEPDEFAAYESRVEEYAAWVSDNQSAIDEVETLPELDI